VVGDGTWLTTGEAATKLGVGEETVRRWFDSGKVFQAGETRKLPGGHRRVLSTAVERLLKEMGGGEG
jgi:excisionase family DNA binding protein